MSRNTAGNDSTQSGATDTKTQRLSKITSRQQNQRNVSKGETPNVGATMRVKTEKKQNKLFKTFHEKVVQYVMENYNKGCDMFPIINLITDTDSDKWAPDGRE